jgi:predicted urease superfamily metal-dependent hydrolase
MAIEMGIYPYEYDKAVEAGTPVEVADACRDLVDTQKAYAEDQSAENLEAYDAAAEVASRVATKYGSDTGMVVQAVTDNSNGSGN